ncbi:DUF3192 domain-containing protein [Desulfosudis oleivorans]
MLAPEKGTTVRRKTIAGTTLLVLFVVSGCATLDSVRTQNRQRLTGLEVGMSKQDVLAHMGTGTVRTWTPPWTCLFLVPPIPTETINNPYSSEIVRHGKQTWELLTYYTDKKQADGALTDDEFTPLVFMEGKLIGWGWRFLADVEARYEIRFR